MTKVNCKMGCVSLSVAIKSREEAIPCYATLVKLHLDFRAQDHKDVTFWSGARRGPPGCLGAGAHACQEKLQELGLSSLEKRRGKGDPVGECNCRMGW